MASTRKYHGADHACQAYRAGPILTEYVRLDLWANIFLTMMYFVCTLDTTLVLIL